MKDFAALLILGLAGFAGPAIIIVAMILRHQQRALIYKERIAAIEKGIDAPPLPVDQRASGRPSEPWAPHQYLLRGLVWLFAGLAMTFALGALSGTTNRPLTTEEKIRMANNARSMGAKDEEIRRLWEDTSARASGLPVGAAALGLIPVAVGTAYLVFYGVERRRLRSQKLE